MAAPKLPFQTASTHPNPAAMQLEILKNTVRLRGIPAEIQAVADGTPAAAESPAAANGATKPSAVCWKPPAAAKTT
ncbi:TPA: hypothetical protein ACFP4Y_000765 [Neisseria bacilliformis]